MRKAFLLAAVLCFAPLTAHALTVAGVDQLLTRFQTVTANWGGPLQLIMLGTFGSLAVIDLAYFVGYRTLMSRGDMSDFMYALVHEVVFLSFFSWLLTTFSITGPLIIKGFQFAAQRAGGIPMTPNGIFASGLKIASTIKDQVSILNPGDSISLILCALVVVGCFAWICASMVYVIIESYFVVSAGQILLMFGGSHFTNDMAVSLLRTCVGIGLKLYALQMIASVGTAFIAAWVAQVGAVTFDGIFVEIGEAIILAAITGRIPAMFERMVGGAGSGGAADLVGSGMAIGMIGKVAAGAAVSAIVKAAGGVAATSAAARLAGGQLNARIEAGSGPNSAAGRAGMLIGSTAKNLASAKVEDISRGLRGTRGNYGEAGFRMSADLGERRRLLDEKASQPIPPTTPRTGP